MEKIVLGGTGEGIPKPGEGSGTPAGGPEGATPGGAPQGGTPPGGPGGTPPAGTGTPPPAAPPPGSAEAMAAGGEGAAVAGGGEAVATTGAAATTTGTATAATTGGAAVGGAAAGGAAAGGAAAGGSALAGVAAAAWPILVALLIILLVIIAIIIIVGVVCFFIFMPGQVTEKLKKMGVAFLDKVQALVSGSQSVVHGEEVADVANYLEKMGYDLKGEGFVTDDITTYSEDSSEPPDGSHYDEVQGVYRSDDTGEVVSIYSDPIKTYIVSDNLCYLVKNANGNLKDATEANPVYVILTVAATLVGFLVSPVVGLATLFAFVAANGGNPAWGSGLISIYHEGGSIGERGDFYKDIETGYITLDAKTKKLEVKRGWTNNAYSFDVDGWSGRYGMPLEFLLSVHVATQMPDLAMEMATSFDTDVEVLLHKVDGGQVEAGFNIGPGTSSDTDFATWDQVMKAVEKDENWFQGGWNKFNEALGSVASWWDSDEYEAFSITDREYYILFKKLKLPHAENCKCCKHMPYSTTDITNDCESDKGKGKLTTGDDFDIGNHVICKACKTNIGKIIAALRQVQDNNWNSYTPYISEVKDHWFRDVRFVIKDIDSTEVVTNDEQYFYETNERWSVYETWQENDPDGTPPEGFEVGDYKLYSYDADHNTYTLSRKTKDEIDDINEKIANGEPDVERLIKKVVTKKISEMKDAEGNALLEGVDGDKWTAYTTQDTSINWTKMEVTEETSDLVKEFEGKLYYKEDRPSDIKQIEDGQRLATNPEIKKMFVENKYYHYDGTPEKADKIAEDRKQHSNPDTNNTSSDSRDEELLGKVSITKDSLAAFSMLENTHTLDADYIYRDFKELIVELDYFDKEELSDKIVKVMPWVIPDCGSLGWPIRKYEKGEAFYGTLINSKADLDYMVEKDVVEAEAILKGLEPEVQDIDVPEPEETPATPTGSPSASSTTTPNISVDQFVEIGYEVHKVMETGEWDYCVNHTKEKCIANNPTGQPCSKAHCNHTPGGHPCGLKPTIQDAEAQNHVTCCATFTSWVLKEAGFDLTGISSMHSATATYDWCKENGWTPITDRNSLQPGDFLFNKQGGQNSNDVSDIGHVQMLGNDWEWLNGGSIEAINNPPKAYTDFGFIIGMRPPLRQKDEPFEGYLADQAVVSPVTGKILDYGTIKRQNIETGEEEEVEFIKILAMDQYTYKDGKGYLECKGDDDANSFKNKATAEDKKKEGYDYFYDEYQGVMEGYVMYMEGFDLTFFDADGAKALSASDPTSNKVTRYEANEVNNMVDDLEEARAYWKEDAKTMADPVLEIDGDIYIKEGTVLGKTYKDPEDFEEKVKSAEKAPIGNGNYIRLIFRNLEDSIVEDVEAYMDVEDDIRADINWELFFWLPYESGAADTQYIADKNRYTGPVSVSSCSAGEVAIGIIQETSLTTWKEDKDTGDKIKDARDELCNQRDHFLPFMKENYPEFYQQLSCLEGKDAEWYWEDFNGANVTQGALKACDDSDHEKFLQAQFEEAMEYYYKPLIEKFPWLEERPACVQGAVLHLYVWGPAICDDLGSHESDSDEDLLLHVRNKIATTSSTAKEASNDPNSGRAWNEPEIAFGILNGKISTAEVEEWVRTGDSSILTDAGIEIR